MAKKKSSGKTVAKGGARKGGAKKKKGAVTTTASKSGTPKKKGAAKKKGTKKASAPKLNDRQIELLRRVHTAGPEGYFVGQKVEQRTIDALHQRKLLKRGPKHKERKAHPYHVTKSGEKHLGSAGTTSADGGAAPTSF